MTRLYRLEAILAHTPPHERNGTTISQRSRTGSALEEMARLLAHQEGEQRLREHLLAGIAEGVAIADARGTITHVNAAYSRITGEAAAQAIGRKLSAAAGAPSLPRLIADQLQLAAGGNGNWVGELPARRPDGEPYRQRVTLQAVHNQEGRLEHYLLILAS